MLDVLKSSVGEWLREGPESDVVLSSRVTLARNVAGYPFLNRATPAQVSEIERMLSDTIARADLAKELQYHRLDNVDDLMLELLMERHLIGREQSSAEWKRGIAFTSDESVSIVVNEDDHLLVRCFRSGFDVPGAAKAAFEIDDKLSEEVPFSFSAEYGYLTASPTRVGTGMRASVMLHLPALVMTREMEKLVRFCHDHELTLRGMYGESTHGSADIYQVFNHVTLGVTEDEILEEVTETVPVLMEWERNARRSLVGQHRDELVARIERAFDLLRTSKMISSEESLSLLSQVKMGVIMGLVEDVSSEVLNELLLLTLPAHLQTIEGREDDRVARNKMRSAYLRRKLENR